MHYAEKPVTTKELFPYIECLWTCSNQDEQCNIAVVPDTFTDIILRYNPSKDPELFISGEMTKAASVPILTGQRYLGIRFKPGFLSPLLDMPMSELTDYDVPLQDLNPTLHSLLRPLMEEPQEAAQLQQMQTVLQKVLRTCNGIDPIVEYAMGLIMQSQGTITVRDLATQTGYSSRQLQRLFLKTVGLPPKLFARIVRFHHARKANNAMDAYYDQSHFIREFKEFTLPQNQ